MFDSRIKRSYHSVLLFRDSTEPIRRAFWADGSLKCENCMIIYLVWLQTCVHFLRGTQQIKKRCKDVLSNKKIGAVWKSGWKLLWINLVSSVHWKYKHKYLTKYLTWAMIDGNQWIGFWTGSFKWTVRTNRFAKVIRFLSAIRWSHPCAFRDSRSACWYYMTHTHNALHLLRYCVTKIILKVERLSCLLYCFRLMKMCAHCRCSFWIAFSEIK